MIISYYNRTWYNYTNPTVTTDTIVKNCSDINVQNVNVSNDAKLKFETPGSVKINGSFKVESGSELRIK